VGSWDWINLLPPLLRTGIYSVSSVCRGIHWNTFCKPICVCLKCSTLFCDKAAVLGLSQWPVRFHCVSPHQSVKINPPYPCHQLWALFKPFNSALCPTLSFWAQNQFSKLWTDKILSFFFSSAKHLSYKRKYKIHI